MIDPFQWGLKASRHHVCDPEKMTGCENTFKVICLNVSRNVCGVYEAMFSEYMRRHPCAACRTPKLVSASRFSHVGRQAVRRQLSVRSHSYAGCGISARKARGRQSDLLSFRDRQPNPSREQRRPGMRDLFHELGVVIEPNENERRDSWPISYAFEARSTSWRAREHTRPKVMPAKGGDQEGRL